MANSPGFAPVLWAGFMAHNFKLTHYPLDKRHVLRDNVRRRFLPLRIVSPKELLQALGEE